VANRHDLVGWRPDLLRWPARTLGRGRPVRADVGAVAVSGHRAVRDVTGSGPGQALDEVGEIIAADRVVERAGAVGEQLAGHRRGLCRDRAGRG
jgi:hypothetical protein